MTWTLAIECSSYISWHLLIHSEIVYHNTHCLVRVQAQFNAELPYLTKVVGLKIRKLALMQEHAIPHVGQEKLALEVSVTILIVIVEAY